MRGSTLFLARQTRESKSSMDTIATLIREGKIADAEASLTQRQGESPTSATWHHERGLLLEAQGRQEEAIDAYENAVRLDDALSEAMFRLAYLHDLVGDEERAIGLYEQLAATKPTHVNALMNLAVLYEDRGQYQDAYVCIERVLAEYPNHNRANMFVKDIESSLTMHYDENQERNREKRNAILDTPITDFELSVRSRNCLKKMNIHTLGDLLKISEVELLGYKNFGETSLNEIKAMLKQKGLRLGQLKEEESRTVRPRPQFLRRAGGPEGSPEILNKYLSEIEFSSRSRKCLQRLNLVTLGDLVSKSEAELLATKNFGQTSLNEIKAKLVEFGLTLRKTD
jgi:DNA-directed RNA polymerase subunit alpha